MDQPVSVKLDSLGVTAIVQMQDGEVYLLGINGGVWKSIEGQVPEGYRRYRGAVRKLRDLLHKT